MRKYIVEILPNVQKFLSKLDLKTRVRIINEVSLLAENARPNGCKKLEGYNGYRVRVGDYRILYEIEDKILLVTIIKIGHRKNIYD